MADKFVELFRAKAPIWYFPWEVSSLAKINRLIAKKTPKGYVWREHGFQHFAEPPNPEYYDKQLLLDMRDTCTIIADSIYKIRNAYFHNLQEQKQNIERKLKIINEEIKRIEDGHIPVEDVNTEVYVGGIGWTQISPEIMSERYNCDGKE